MASKRDWSDPLCYLVWVRQNSFILIPKSGAAGNGENQTEKQMGFDQKHFLLCITFWQRVLLWKHSFQTIKLSARSSPSWRLMLNGCTLRKQAAPTWAWDESSSAVQTALSALLQLNSEEPTDLSLQSFTQRDGWHTQGTLNQCGNLFYSKLKMLSETKCDLRKDGSSRFSLFITFHI